MRTIAVVCKNNQQFLDYIQSVPSENVRVKIIDFNTQNSNIVYDGVVELEFLHCTFFCLKLKQ